MRTKLIVFAVVGALGVAGTLFILQTSQAAAIVFGVSSLVVAIAAFSGGRKKADGKKPKDKMPGHAVALRQSRAMVRGEDGEIRGLPGGPA
ncbi:hypothetical protein [Pyruvatibacter sp.]|uniref:hypothetical protein n=1 Tax=Pyruvatibacter sp. TaxID=1981328 RepID=UPI0032EF60F1